MTIVLEDELPYPWHTIERGEHEGETIYYVYGWRTPPHARRVSNARTQVVEAFPSVEAALSRYPRANITARVIPLPACPRQAEKPASTDVAAQRRPSWARNFYAWLRALKRILV